MDLFKHRAGAYQKAAAKKEPSSETPPSLPPKTGLVKQTKTPASTGEAKPKRQDIARYLILIGSEEATKILKHLSETEVEAIAREIGAIESISAEESKAVLAKFQGFVKTPRTGPATGGAEVARDILKTAFGEEQGDRLFRQALPPIEEPLFNFMKDLDARQINVLLKPEPIAVRAIVLAWLAPVQAAGVIKLSSPVEQKDIIVRLAGMQRIDREVLSRIDANLRERARDSAKLVHEEIDGKSSLANIMRHLDPTLEQNLLDDLAEEAPDLAQDIRERLFTIETILLIDDKDLQKVLSSLDDKLIALLLKGKSDGIRKKLLTNVSDSRANLIREEFNLLGPQPRRDVDKMTREFIATLKILENDGTIRVRREDDEYV